MQIRDMVYDHQTEAELENDPKLAVNVEKALDKIVRILQAIEDRVRALDNLTLTTEGTDPKYGISIVPK